MILHNEGGANKDLARFAGSVDFHSVINGIGEYELRMIGGFLISSKNGILPAVGT